MPRPFAAPALGFASRLTVLLLLASPAVAADPAGFTLTVDPAALDAPFTGRTFVLLTRQKLPVLDGTAERAPTGVPAGAYVLAAEAATRPDVVLIGTGSEVQVCIAAREQLATRGIAARVVSMPSWYLFEQQPDDYRAGHRQ